MILIIAIVVLALSANSCAPSPEPMPSEPRGEPGPVLDGGDYKVTVVSVQDAQCRGASPQEFQGQVAWGVLTAGHGMEGGGVTFNLQGVMLRGNMYPGSLTVSGSLLSPPAEDEPPTTRPAEGDVDYADTGAPAGRGGSSSGSSGSSNGGQPSGGADRPPQAGEAWATLEATIYPENHAVGQLAISSADCSYHVTVSLDPGSPEMRQDDTGVVEHPTEPTADTGADTGGGSDPSDGSTGDTGMNSGG